MDIQNKKILVAYFSRKGMNYRAGEIIELKKGNTEVVAEKIAAQTSAKLFEIVSKQGYSFEYKPCAEQAVAELKANARPELVNDMDISDYDIIFVGYPNWCGTMPMPVWTFLDAHDFTGKIVLPFCTHEGSKMGKSEENLRQLLPTAELKAGLPVHGGSLDEADESIRQWIASL